MTYLCKDCNKEFKTLSGLWKHNKKYHNNNELNITQSNSFRPQNNSKLHNNLQCKFCNKILSRIDNLHRHEKICKQNINSVNNLTEINKLKKELMNEINKIKSKTINKTINNITNNNLINNNNIINITNIGTENINDLTKYEKNNICNSNVNAITTLIDNMFFNYRLPNNHKIYNSALNNKHINIIENNKIVKKKKTVVYDIMFTPCVKMIESILVLNKKNIKDCKEIIDFYHTMPIHKKLMKAYHDEVNLMSYNKKDLILNTWNKLLQNKSITEEESNIVKQSIEELKNSNEEFESSSDSDNENNNNDTNVIPNIYIKKDNKK
jgi:hypothetical protein